MSKLKSNKLEFTVLVKVKIDNLNDVSKPISSIINNPDNIKVDIKKHIKIKPKLAKEIKY